MSVAETAHEITTKFCVMKDFQKSWFSGWLETLRRASSRAHRKDWELALIAQGLTERGCLAPGKKGFGFGVGRDPITAFAASRGCQILATDLGSAKWNTQEFETSRVLNAQGLCPPELFEARVRLSTLDMNWIEGESGRSPRLTPADIRGHDFTWSICSLDHLGSIWLSQRFLYNQMNCLQPGGWALHTGEYTLSRTAPRAGPTVFFQYPDILQIVQDLQTLGHNVSPIDWTLGSDVADHHVDAAPWSGTPSHLKVSIPGGFTTCVLFVVQRGDAPEQWIPSDQARARELFGVG